MYRCFVADGRLTADCDLHRFNVDPVVPLTVDPPNTCTQNTTFTRIIPVSTTNMLVNYQ